MLVSRYVRVQCLPPCDRPAGPVDVPLAEVAAGVYARPALHCSNCGRQLAEIPRTVEEEGTLADA